MRTKRRIPAAVRWVALAPALLALAPAAAQAADLRQGSDVTIPAGVTVADDLYATGGTVHVNGTIAGSLIAAGGNVDVTGTVQHDGEEPADPHEGAGHVGLGRHRRHTDQEHLPNLLATTVRPPARPQ